MENNEYQKLLSKDPIGAFNKIKENYLRYFKTMYRFRDPDINDRKNEELEKGDNLLKEPYVEILPEYNNYTDDKGNIKGLADLTDKIKTGFENAEDANDFTEKFISSGLMNYPPYKHQVEMLEKVFVQKKNTVINSGTGSGKTESFLLPLMASLYKEALTWPRPKYNSDWFQVESSFENAEYKNDKGYLPVQRDGETRPAAIRALILYPMNALVEDQMTRLRKALDSDGVRKFFDSEDGLKGNRIFFGRYNGNTPVAGSQTDENKQVKSKEELDNLAEQSHKIEKFVKKKGNKINEDDYLYITPRLCEDTPTAEMITRWDMQETPPDILITNFSMLSIMLIREIESGIFLKTKEWLAEKKENVFHLIIDELHLFRGTQGTEIAYLIRMFLDTIGLPPVIDNGNGGVKPNPQLRIMASSASLGDPDETQKYLEEFFGAYNSNGEDAFEVQPGSDYISNNTLSDKFDLSVFEMIVKENYLSSSDERKIEIEKQLAKQLACDSLDDFFKTNSEAIFGSFQKIMHRSEIDGTLVPKSLEDIAGALFKKNKDALRGFFIIRATEKINKYSLPRFRFHQFYKYVEGLWAELLPQEDNNKQKPFGDFLYEPKDVLVSKDKQTTHKVLETLRCEVCGEAFIGGNKNRINNTKWQLSLNSPNLDKIPNMNSTPMVQNKHYHEYAIFWPKKHNYCYDSNIIEIKETNNNLKGHKNILNQTAYNIVGVKEIWKQSSLNPYNGEIFIGGVNNSSNIQGYTFVLTDNNNIDNLREHDINNLPLEALPHKCPACSNNFIRKKYTHSPIRSFRTGIARSNQILSKELIYQLSGEKPKLIGFSDSREDAASQAFGIAREHYRDMVRMLFIKSIDEISQPNKRIIELIASTREIGGIIYQNENKQMFSDVSDEIFNIVVPAVLANNVEVLSRFTNPKDNFNIEDLIGKNLDGILTRKLLKLGLNVNGIEYSKESFTFDKKEYHWSNLYDFEKGQWDTIDNVRNKINDINYNGNNTLQQDIKDIVASTIFKNTFGIYMGLNTESSGIGYITANNLTANNLANLFIYLPNTINPTEFINAYIRVMGDNFRYVDPDSYGTDPHTEYNNLTAKFKEPIRKIAELYMLDEITLGNHVYNLIHNIFGNEEFVIKPNSLSFKVVNSGDNYYKCENCGKIHLHRGMGICTNTQCLQELPHEVSGYVSELRNNNYISHDIFVEPRDPMSLHTEELTGQTDNQAERQLQFKGVFVDENPAEKLTKEIDMVNVTTTMEVGVDIGSLEAVFQGNMPPTRYNYQQRVGRGGRRGQAYSTAFTFCRGKSHDTYYYHNALDEITGGKNVAPKLTVAPSGIIGEEELKLPIVKRIITKHILREAFISTNNQSKVLSDNHGEFGETVNWHDVKDSIENWINNNTKRIKEITNYYLNQFSNEGKVTEQINELNNWYKDSLIKSINRAVENNLYTEGLAQTLAEFGLLPMFGMPSDIRSFYHGSKGNGYTGSIREIDRPIEQSITEFAPGASKTKDKGEYTSAGLTIPLKWGNYGNQKYGICAFDKFKIKGLTEEEIHQKKEKFNALEHSYSLSINEDNSEIFTIDKGFDVVNNAENEDNNESQAIRLVIPKAFRTAKIRGNQGSNMENSDSRSNYATSRIWAKENGSLLDRKIYNCKILLFTPTEENYPEIWTINDNNGNLFKGYSVKNFDRDYTNIIGGNQEIALSPNFILDNEIDTIPDNAQESKIALGAKKTTELFKIEISSIPNSICLDINEGYAPAIKSAFYSAAFILQRVLTDKLDVEPREIQISELKINEAGIPYLYLSDNAANGSGFVNYLYSNFESILTEILDGSNKFINSITENSHSSTCKTSCQKCLNAYDNSAYHHILDWRLGLGLLRLMQNKYYQFGFNEDLYYSELIDLVDIINQTSNTYAKVKSNAEAVEGKKGINYIQESIEHNDGVFGNGVQNKKNMMIVHPLWNINNFIINSEDFIGVRIDKTLNFFELLRIIKD